MAWLKVRYTHVKIYLLIKTFRYFKANKSFTFLQVMLFYEQQLVINFNPFKCQPHKFTCINLLFSCSNYLQIFKDYATEGGTEVRPANF